MKLMLRRKNYDSLLRVGITLLGIFLNVVLGFIIYIFKLPLYLDTAGTMLVAAIGGIFPGIATAVASNVIAAVFNKETIYFGFINALVAICTAWFIREKKYSNIRNIVLFTISIGTMSGLLSSFVQWFFLGEPKNLSIQTSVESFSDIWGINKLLSFVILNTILSIFDKGISFVIAFLIFNFFPEEHRSRIKNSGWKQRPLSLKEVKELDSISSGYMSSLKMRTSIKLLACSLALTIIMSWVGISLYFDIAKQEKAESAVNAARFVAETIDPYIINKAVENGENVTGYAETKTYLEMIKNNAVGVDHIFISQIRKDGFYIAFDIDVKESDSFLVGQKVDFKKEILPYMDSLVNGEKIDPIECRDTDFWGIIAFYPIYDANDILRGYVGAEVYLNYLTVYMWRFLLKVILIMAGFYILILAFGLWTSGTGLVYPINSIEMSIDHFIKAGDDQLKLDEAVRNMRSLDIHTGDEIEKMYKIICDMALNQTEKIRSVRRFSDATLKMQDGLIITMADMVESRDSDTGAHIQKTSEYSRIIVEALERKGYYPEKINEKFKSDVVRSAPLHDIGKINISDKILNKPGKLTDEEYEIMKTHASAGREIIEKAINTVKGESYLKEARNMAAYHHERWDGTGYPDGLHGEVIPLSARIMAVADVFDALTSPRVYKPAFPLEKALTIIEEGAGTQFDPKCVEALLDSLPEVKVIMSKYNHLV